MAVNLSPYGGVGAQFLDNAGNVLTGGKIYTYSAGTTTPQAVYTTSAGIIFHPNPIILDASGRVPSGGEIWLTDGLLYKFVLTDSNDVLIATYDNISGINSNFVAFTNQQEIQIATAGQTVFNLATTTYQPGTNSLSVFVDGVNQYGPGAQYAYLETDSDTVTFVNGLHVGASVKFTTSQLNTSGSTNTAGQVSFTGFKGQTGTVQDLADDDGSDWIGFDPAGTSAVARSAQDKMRDIVSVKDFGAIGNNVADDTIAIQAAIDYAINLGSTVYFPVGTYLITSPLFIYKPSTFITCNLVGQSFSERTDRGVIINHASLLTVPGIIIQGARQVTIDNIQLIGPNSFAAPTTSNITNAATYVGSGVRDSTYSPQAGICVDAFQNGVPSDGGYPGLSSYYTAASVPSSRVCIKNCELFNQLIGICFSPAGLEGNNEDGIIENIKFNGTKVCVALCQNMIKVVRLSSIFSTTCYTVVDTYSYGPQPGLGFINGSAGFIWTHGDIVQCAFLLKIASQLGNNVTPVALCKIEGVYAEGLISLGWIGTQPGTGLQFSNVPVHFDSCSFWFDSFSSVANYSTQLMNFAPVKFTACIFCSKDPSVAPPAANATAMRFYLSNINFGDQIRYCISFDSCGFLGQSNILFNDTAMPFVTMRDCVGYGPNFKSNFSDKYLVNNLNELTFSNAIFPNSTIYTNNNSQILQVAQYMNNVSLGSLAVTVSGATATFTSDPTSIKLGDNIYASGQSLPAIDGSSFSTVGAMCIGVVSNIVGTTITISYIPSSLSSSTYDLYVRWYPFMHGASTVATTNGTPNITITQTDGLNWTIGQRIISTNIPSGAYIVSGTWPNFVISKNATATASGVRCYDANCKLTTSTNF